MDPLKHQVACFGEVLWDILPSGALPGGAPMNVAYHLKKLGINPALITKIGADGYGEKLVNILSQSEVSTDYFQVDYAYPTGLVYANISNHNEVRYDIVFPSAWDFIGRDEEDTKLVSEADFFVFGSLTSRSQTSRSTLYELLEVAKTKVIDINLRAPHYDKSSIESLLFKANILKMNEEELKLITGWFSGLEDVEDRIKLLQERFSLDIIIVTLGGDGAIVMDGDKFYRHPGYKIRVADTIGSGDSFLAGFISKLIEGSSVDNALAFSAGIGAFIATQSGACPKYQLSQITEIMQSKNQQNIQTI
jgi:fructokinase